MTNKVPEIAFLGLADRYNCGKYANTNIPASHIMGLKTHIISFIYPYLFSNSYAIFAVYKLRLDHEYVFRLVDEDGKQVCGIQFSSQQQNIEELTPTFDRKATPFYDNLEWQIVPIPLKSINFGVYLPGKYDLFYVNDDKEDLRVGSLLFHLYNPAPFTKAKKASIEANPYASKSVRWNLNCKNCNDAVKAFVDLKREKDIDDEGYVWYENLPDTWNCSCNNKDSTDLTIIKRNLYAYLGNTNSTEIDSVPLYERVVLETIYQNFSKLLEEARNEEQVQIFIQENLILLHSFTPEKIFFKAPITTRYKTDFAILTHSKEFILIELEKPTTKLLNKRGTHSDLTHAFDQVTDWLHECKENKASVIRSIGKEGELKSDEISLFKAVVIAGRDDEYEPNRLKKLKSSNQRQDISFMTYTDLLNGFQSLVDSFRSHMQK